MQNAVSALQPHTSPGTQKLCHSVSDINYYSAWEKFYFGIGVMEYIGYAVYTKVSSIYFLKFQTKKKNNGMTLNLLIAEVEIC